MLELAVLGLLKERSMHGYQLSRQLTDSLGGLWRVSYGSLYPTLRRLERQGAVEVVFDAEQVGRRKNVYRITDDGERLFFELLQESGGEGGEDNRFRVRLTFFKYLAPETRIRLLERRRVFLEERLSTIRSSMRSNEQSDTYTHALIEHGEQSTQQDITWLDDLIQAERTRSKTAQRKPARTKSTRRKTKTQTPRGGTKRRREPAAALRGKEPTT
jgi:DNA-binding PadR family transcriptional regulator